VNYYEDDFRPVVAPRNTYVPARSYQDISMNEQALMGQVVSAAGTVMAHRQMSHLSRSDETPLLNAAASLLYSVVYSIAGAVITGAILFLAYTVFGGAEGFYALLWVFLWGICLLTALYFNRRQGLHYSPAGLDHHEIESRERITMYLIDRHIDLLEKKWKLENRQQ
jgi:hypothetical protein